LRDVQGIRPRLRATCTAWVLRLTFSVEESRGVGLHGVFAHKERSRHLARAHAAGDVLQDLQLPWRDAQLRGLGVVADESSIRHGDLPNDDHFFRSGEGQPEADAHRREDQRNQAAVDLDGVLDDQEPVFDQPQGNDEQAAARAVKEDRLLHSQRIRQARASSGILKRLFLSQPRGFARRTPRHALSRAPLAWLAQRSFARNRKRAAGL
jgi:hypothetical protein